MALCHRTQGESLVFDVPQFCHVMLLDLLEDSFHFVVTIGDHFVVFVVHNTVIDGSNRLN